MQAWLLGHSEFLIHSGLQLGGVPIYSDKQAQEAWPFILRHSEYGPQGDGTQGFSYIGGKGDGLSTEINIAMKSIE